MKKGTFYILINDGHGGKTAKRREGYLYDSGRNTYGIDNRGTTARPRWTFTEIKSGLSNGQEYRTRAAAGEACNQYESAILNSRTTVFYKDCVAVIAEAYKAEPIAHKEKQPRPIKSRTYTNFCRVMNAIEAKGYPTEEAAEITRHIFDEYEQNPAGLPISGRIDLIATRATYHVMYYYQNGAKRAEIRRDPALTYMDIPAAGIEEDKHEIRKHDPGAVFTDETGHPYIFRTFTGWTVYDSMTAERILYAATDEEAEAIARAAASGRAYTCNRMEAAEKATDGEKAEQPTESPEQATPEDVQTLLKLFSGFYNQLYDREEDPDPATRAAADAIGREYCRQFDEYSQSRPAILAAFTEARRDFITSDREAAAFMLALEALTKAKKAPKEEETAKPTPTENRPENGQKSPIPTEATQTQMETTGAPEEIQTPMEAAEPGQPASPEETAGDSQTTMDSPTEAPAEADPAGRYQTAMEDTSPAADHKTDGRPAPAADGQTPMEDGGKAGQAADGQTGMDGGKARGRQTGMEGPEKGRNSPTRAEPLQTTTRDGNSPKCAKNPPYTPRPELSTICTRGSPVKTVNPMPPGQGGQL